MFAVIDSESAGFGSLEVIVLLSASAVLAAAFIWRERRAAYPLLDLRFLRVPQFTAPNIAAFCIYFSTFAIFFFTALYLVEAVGASGYRLALVFLPLTVLMTASSVLAGRWTAAAGPRWSITVGCLLFAAGLFVTDGCLSPHPCYAALAAALGLAGLGIGTSVCRSPQRSCPRCRLNAPALPPRPPTPAGSSAASLASRSSARW